VDGPHAGERGAGDAGSLQGVATGQVAEGGSLSGSGHACHSRMWDGGQAQTNPRDPGSVNGLLAERTAKAGNHTLCHGALEMLARVPRLRASGTIGPGLPALAVSVPWQPFPLIPPRRERLPLWWSTA
jgi:hypothetical protein